ncbi:hypothetical protein Ac2012v2_007325 [Leucoagaricus gongylophorus]
MANFYRDTFLCLFLLTRLSSVLSALYPTQPVANTVFYCGNSALVTWVDTRHKPHVAGLGDLTIKLHTSQDDYVATLASGVNPALYGTQVTLPLDLWNDTLYVLRFSAPGLLNDVWTADFTILPGDSSLSSRPMSSAPRESTTGSLFSSPTSGQTQLSETIKQIGSSILPVTTITADSLDSSSSPPRRNSAVYGKADQLDKAQFRLLFIVWPALFGLCMAL